MKTLHRNQNAGGTVWGPALAITNAPHLLIAGTTGSGKSVLLHNLIECLLARFSPAVVDIALCDPKRVELNRYRKFPQCKSYARTPGEILGVLKLAAREMERRYKIMERRGARDWDGAQMYIIIDELADLMISPLRADIVTNMQHLLQLGRAAKIHIIAATQAPNRKIIPAELVLNFTDRLALRCLSSIESRQIIGVAGAEELPQYGAGLWLDCAGRLQTVVIPGLRDDEYNRLLEWYTA